MGHVCPETAEPSRQRRGWTPARLAEALRAAGLGGSKNTLLRAAGRGEIPHERTVGGHVRFDALWVFETYGLTLDGEVSAPVAEPLDDAA